MHRSRIRKEVIGSTTDPTGVRFDVCQYTLKSSSGVEIGISTLGAALVRATIPRADGQRIDVVYGPKSLNEAIANSAQYQGVVMGRFGRIVSNGHLLIGQTLHQLVKNADQHHIHGGSDGFDKFIWRCKQFEREELVGLVLELDRPAGDQGYPGGVRARVCYALDARGAIHIGSTMRSDASTLAGLVFHPFWDLTGTGNIDSMFLEISADQTIIMDENFVPNGQFAAVEGTQSDFRRARLLAGRQLDICYIPQRELARRSPVARIWDDQTGISLQILSTQPCLAIYTGDHLHSPRAGICLQPGPMPDAANRPEFPSAILHAGERLRQWMTFRLSTAK